MTRRQIKVVSQMSRGELGDCAKMNDIKKMASRVIDAMPRRQKEEWCLRCLRGALEAEKISCGINEPSSLVSIGLQEQRNFPDIRQVGRLTLPSLCLRGP